MSPLFRGVLGLRKAMFFHFRGVLRLEWLERGDLRLRQHALEASKSYDALWRELAKASGGEEVERIVPAGHPSPMDHVLYIIYIYIKIYKYIIQIYVCFLDQMYI